MRTTSQAGSDDPREKRFGGRLSGCQPLRLGAIDEALRNGWTCTDGREKAVKARCPQQGGYHALGYAPNGQNMPPLPPMREGSDGGGGGERREGTSLAGAHPPAPVPSMVPPLDRERRGSANA